MMSVIEELNNMEDENRDRFVKQFLDSILDRVDQVQTDVPIMQILSVYRNMNMEERETLQASIFHCIKDKYRPYLYNLIRVIFGLDIVEPENWDKQTIIETIKELQQMQQ